jgi:hypothetical protein
MRFKHFRGDMACPGGGAARKLPTKLFQQGGPDHVTGEPRMGRRAWHAWLPLLILCASCNKGGSDGTTSAEERRTEPQPLVAKDCSGGDTKEVDVNSDGKPDITHHVRGGKRLCSVMDLNFDGRGDLLRFYADDGEALKLEQHDYDFDGRIDDQIFYKAGTVSQKELDTNFDGLIDTWMWCKGPLVEKAERARRKPGRVDTWETYSKGMLAEIQYDENADGRVEKWESFQDGSLTEVRLDTTGDGKADRTDPAGSASSDQRDKQVSCDGTALPAESDAPKFPAGDGTGVDGGTVPTTPTAGTPDAGVAAPAVAADAGVATADGGSSKSPTTPASKAADAGAAPVDAFQPTPDAGKAAAKKGATP